VKRRTEVVGLGHPFGPMAGMPSLPDDAAVIRLVGAIPLAQHDEWAVRRARCMTQESVAAVSDDPIVSLANMAG
jgi:hypothetical protein